MKDRTERDRDPERVSVVIPCYNQGRFLADAIESARAQTPENVEICVVDDGSSDTTASVAARYPDVLVVRQEHRGASAARNAGLRRSRGAYVVFLDADDRLLPDALAVGMRALAANVECAFVYGHVRLIAADGTPLPSPRDPCIAANHYLELLRANYIWTTGAVMYRRACVEAVGGFDPRVKACNDLELNLRLTRRFPVCCHEAVVLEYRQHESNTTRDMALMLKWEMITLASQWRHVRGDRRLKAALRAGMRGVQADYGERLVSQVLTAAGGMDWGRAAAGVWALSRYYPGGLIGIARRMIGPGRPPGPSEDRADR